MIRALIRRKIDSVERELGVSMDYVRHIQSVSLRAFFKLARFASVADYRRAAPAAALDVARLVAIMDADCGSCLQIEVNVAKKHGVPANIVRAVLDHRPEDLPQELADVYHFAREVVEASGGDGPYRQRIRQRYGEEALIELALGIGTCRVYPLVKRALGYATSCAKVTLEV